MSFGSGSLVSVVLTGSPDPRQHPFGFGQLPVSGQLCEATGGGPAACLGFLSPFGYRHSLPRSSDPRWEIGPSLRSADQPRGRGRIPSGFPRSTRTRCDRGGCLLYLGGGGAHSADKKSPADACRFPAASPCTPPGIPSARLTHNETSTEVHAIHPSGLPLARDPRMEQGSFGFPTELRTPPLPATHAEGGARPSSTGLRLRIRHQPVLQSASPLARATSCRNFFFVSTLRIGCPAAVKVAICSSMWANWTSRSG